MHVFHGDVPELETLLLALQYNTEKHQINVEKAYTDEKNMLEEK
jgi:hypothetical protein